MFYLLAAGIRIRVSIAMLFEYVFIVNVMENSGRGKWIKMNWFQSS